MTKHIPLNSKLYNIMKPSYVYKGFITNNHVLQTLQLQESRSTMSGKNVMFYGLHHTYVLNTIEEK